MIERFDAAHPSTNPVYNRFRSEHLRRYGIAADLLAKHLPSNSVVVDAAFGCGYGYSYLGKRWRYVGLDASSEALYKAKLAYPDADFRLSDLDSAGAFGAISPNAIVSLETAEHLRDPKAFLRRAYDALPYGGSLVFSAPVSLTRDFDPYHKWNWPAARWQQEITDAGFWVTYGEAMPFIERWSDFLHTVPTTWAQKARIASFLLVHPKYLLNRLWYWGVRNEFYWCSHIFHAVKRYVAVSDEVTARRDFLSRVSAIFN